MNTTGQTFSTEFDFSTVVSAEKIERIRAVPHFRESMYAELDIVKTLEFYYGRYVKQLIDFTEIDKGTTIVDVGAGYGWLLITFALTTPAKLIAVEIDEPRLEAATRIAKILGVYDKIDWRVGGLGSLPATTNEANVAYCIEVLEHVYRSPDALKDLARISSDLLIVTTPNLWFPVIAHDTRLPFCHWLPIPIRIRYAKLFNRHEGEVDNLFWSPATLGRGLRDFKVVSNFLHYSSYTNFKETFPFYLPYGVPEQINTLGKKKQMYYDLASKLKGASRFVLPSLACVYKRK